MELIRGLHNLRQKHRGCALTIGNFDGLHLGHQALITTVKQQAKKLNLPSVVMTFEPLPQEYFKHQPLIRLMGLRDKFRAIQSLGIDRLFCLYFNQTLASFTAEEFIEKILIQGLGIRYLVVGDDFRFGRNRTGDYALLKEASQKYGFELQCIPSVVIENKRVSSSWVRESLQQGNLKQAAQLLGRCYSITGRVIAGDGLGRTWGIPTANIDIHRQHSPVLGIFAVRVYGLNKRFMNGVASVGTRPTLGHHRLLLEVHLFDYDNDIYGHQLRVEFLHKIRDEENFPSIELLKQKIHQDIAEAKQFFLSLRLKHD
ncbi:MAG: bifunctional riboflavin kinase/FAD synthetase [Proteobacteria bacterium]|nr:bifunctional riboflavin kinase/FAD synthetase [Pseudomonadota bacterium]